jgi:hypothetical protein
MKEAFTTQASLAAMHTATTHVTGPGSGENPVLAIPLAETIADLRFKENVYQSLIEVSRRTLAVLSRCEFTQQ